MFVSTYMLTLWPAMKHVLDAYNFSNYVTELTRQFCEILFTIMLMSIDNILHMWLNCLYLINFNVVTMISAMKPRMYVVCNNPGKYLEFKMTTLAAPHRSFSTLITPYI